MAQGGTSSHRLHRTAPIEKVLHRVVGAVVMTSPQEVGDVFAVRVCSLEHEMFKVLHLDAENRVIDYVKMLHWTLTQTAVYPREVLEDASTSWSVLTFSRLCSQVVQLRDQ